MRDRYSCDEEEVTKWANDEHVDKYEYDEVVLCRNSMFDEWTPSYYAYYGDGRHCVFADRCSSITALDTTPVNYVIKYDKELAWTRDYH